MLLCALLLASCSLSNSPPSSQKTPTGTSGPVSQGQSQTFDGPINRPVSTTGCGQASPITPGTSVNVTISSHPGASLGNHTRIYRVHVPSSYTMNRPQAIILAFHGYSGTATGMEGSSGLSPLSDQQDFFAVYPQGLLDPHSGKHFWAEIGPIDFGVDDVLFVSDVLNDLQKQFCIDAQRIYATGFSNGGGMVALLACRFAGRIAAFAPVSGNHYAIPTGCKPGRPVPILNFHGANDPLIPYDGVPITVAPDWPVPSMPQWLQDWASRDGCTTGPVTFLQEAHVVGEQWTGCQGSATVIHYRVVGGGHAWPPPIDGHSPATVMWLFFQAHPLL